MNSYLPRRNHTLFALMLITLAGFALSPMAQAQLSPPQDGGYPGNNTAEGNNALDRYTTAHDNTAIGHNALTFDDAGSHNTAVGSQALLETGFSTTGGDYNTGTGAYVMYLNTSGSSNTAIGARALSSNSTGSGNIAIGAFAGSWLTTGDNNIDIGNNDAVNGEANTIRIGQKGTQTATFIAGISGVTVSGTPAPVVIDGNGQLGTADISTLKGSKGDKGDKGDTGESGAAGPQGEKGDTGATGTVGPQGPPGPQGVQGNTGPAGAGLVSGSFLFLAQNVTAPSGYTFVTTTQFTIGSGRRKTEIPVNIYQKN